MNIISFPTLLILWSYILLWPYVFLSIQILNVCNHYYWYVYWSVTPSGTCSSYSPSDWQSVQILLISGLYVCTSICPFQLFWFQNTQDLLFQIFDIFLPTFCNVYKTAIFYTTEYAPTQISLYLLISGRDLTPLRECFPENLEKKFFCLFLGVCFAIW